MTQSPDRADTAPAPESKPLMSIGRDVNGRFQSGNPGGPGNPFARKVASLRKALLESVSDEDVQQVIEAIKQKARQGDVAAARLLLSYAVGRPGESKDPDRMDIEEWRWLQQMRVSTKQFQETVNSMPAGLSCFLAGLNWACNTQSNAVTPLVAGLARIDDPAPAAPRKRAPSTNGRKKSDRRRAPSGDTAPSANGDAGSNGRHEEGAAPAELLPAPAPSANGVTPSDERPEPPAVSAPGECPSPPPAPSAKGRKKSAGCRQPTGEAAAAENTPAPAPSADEERAAAAAADVLMRLHALLGQFPPRERDDHGDETGRVRTMTPQGPPPDPSPTDPPGAHSPPAPSANGGTEPDGRPEPSGESGPGGRSST